MHSRGSIANLKQSSFGNALINNLFTKLATERAGRRERIGKGKREGKEAKEKVNRRKGEEERRERQSPIERRQEAGRRKERGIRVDEVEQRHPRRSREEKEPDVGC